VTSGEQSSRLKGSVIAADLEGQRTTAVAEMEEQIIKCDSLYADNTVHLFTEVSWELPSPSETCDCVELLYKTVYTQQTLHSS